MQAQRLAPGVHAQVGANEESTPRNRGEIANAGLLIGRRSALVFDTGSSRADGQRYLAALRALTAKPVTAVVLSHADPAFIFGAAAFQDAGIPIWASSGTAVLMAERCEHCLQRAVATLGAGHMRGTRLVVPDMQLAADLPLDLGESVVDILHFRAASAPDDLAAFDRKSGILFAGGLVLAHRIPNLRDADLEAWLAALARLERMPITRIVPGQGAIGGPELIGAMRDYLQDLDRVVRAHYARGDSLIETMADCALPAYADWQGYELRHAQNVSYRYRQLETAELRAGEPDSRRD